MTVREPPAIDATPIRGWPRQVGSRCNRRGRTFHLARHGRRRRCRSPCQPRAAWLDERGGGAPPRSITGATSCRKSRARAFLQLVLAQLNNFVIILLDCRLGHLGPAGRLGRGRRDHAHRGAQRRAGRGPGEPRRAGAGRPEEAGLARSPGAARRPAHHRCRPPSWCPATSSSWKPATLSRPTAPARGRQPARRRGRADRRIGPVQKNAALVLDASSHPGRPQEHRLHGHDGRLRPRPRPGRGHRHAHAARPDRRHAAERRDRKKPRCSSGWTSLARSWAGARWPSAPSSSWWASCAAACSPQASRRATTTRWPRHS